MMSFKFCANAHRVAVAGLLPLTMMLMSSGASASERCYEVSHTVAGSRHHAMTIPRSGLARDFQFDPKGSFIEQEDGTAILSGRLVSKGNPNKIFDAQVTLSGYVAPGMEGHDSIHPKTEFQSAVAREENVPNWRYYTEIEGMLDGKGVYEGASLKLTRRGPPFQIGIRANGKNASYGASMWMSYEVIWDNKQPDKANPLYEASKVTPNKRTGDFNLDFNACPKLLVEMGDVSATALKSGVMVSWNTAAEVDNAGFNVWRAIKNAKGEFVDVVKVNSSLIAAQGGAISGMNYSFTDTTVTSGTYYYALESIEVTGNSEFHLDQTVSVTLP